MTGIGLPHSEIPGSEPACSSPRLIAACRVLRRPPMPRHPSCALDSLTTKKSIRNTTGMGAAPGPPDAVLRRMPPIPQMFAPVQLSMSRSLFILRGGGATTAAAPPRKTTDRGGRTWIRTRDLVLIRDAL